MIEVIDANLNRALEDETLAIKNGFVLKRPIYQMGTRVNSIGAENYKKSRQDFEKLSFANEEAQKVIQIVKEENRDDSEETIRDYWLNSDNGRLYKYSQQFTSDGLVVTEHSLRQLIRRSRPNSVHDIDEGHAVLDASNYIANVNAPIEWRASLANKYLETAKDKKNEVLKAVFRTRDYKFQNISKRELYAVVSDRFNNDCDVDEICRILAEKDSDTRATSLYDGEKFRFDLLYHSDIVPENCVAGEVFKAGVTVRSSDNGTQGIKISPFVIRNLCLNLIILDRAEQNISLTHLRKNLKEDLQDSIDLAFSKVKDFKERWEAANKENILEDLFKKDPQEVFTKLVKMGHVRIPGVSQKEMAQRLFSAWQLEPQMTRAGIINAVTRSAHVDKWSSVWATSQMEEQGGALLYAKLNLN